MTENKSVVWKHNKTGQYLVLTNEGTFSNKLIESQSFDIDKAYVGFHVPYEIRHKGAYESIPVLIKRSVELSR